MVLETDLPGWIAEHRHGKVLKHVTAILDRRDYKEAKELALKGFFPSVAELIRCAIIHFTFIERIEIKKDYISTHSRPSITTKTPVPIHLSDTIKQKVLECYQGQELTYLGRFSYSLCIRVFLHEYLHRLKQCRETAV